MFKVLGRYSIYAFMIAFGSVSMMLIAEQLPAGLQFERLIIDLGVTTSEFSPVEILQNILLLICISLFGWIASRDRLRRPMALSFCVLFLVCFVREMDFFLDFYVVDNLWQVVCALLFAITFVYLGRHWHRFEQGLRRSWPSTGLAIIMSGFILLVPFAQLMGHNLLWQEIMGENYVRVVKVAVEEFIELGAYAILTIGSIEFLYSWARLPQTRKLHARIKPKRYRPNLNLR
ncbi:MAG: hypothetical protein VYA80_04860 [Pseudomonadota bacterium]|nr:hypothetical protein [Pseudomonadota bacterium]